jgi:hypothetical protein
VKAGRRARSAFLAHYDLPQGVSRICEIIAGPLKVSEKAVDPNYALNSTIDPSN